MRWLQIGMIALMLCLLILIGIYLYHYIKRTAAFWGVHIGKKYVRWILMMGTACLVACALSIWNVGAIVLLYLVLTAACMELIQFLVRKLWRRGKRIWDAVYQCGLVPVIAAAAIVSIGYYNMTHIRETSYTIYTEKAVENYRIALISDLHFGTTMDEAELQRYCGQISDCGPDIVVLCGDIVDENTSLKQMQAAFQKLGEIKSTYGIFFVYGNHDKSQYRSSPNYTPDELAKAIERSGIHILADETYLINDDLVLIGRDDAAAKGGRKSSEMLLQDLDTSRFLLLIDHQPLALALNSTLAYDLQVSGHTHGGQIWPLGLLNQVFRFNELNYGYEKQGKLQVVVSSGMGGWGYPIRTEKVSEYVVLDIKGTGGPG